MSVAQASGKKLATFSYIAVNAQDKTVKGKIKAGNEAAAGRLLAARELRLVKLEPYVSQFTLEEALPSLFGVKPEEVIPFSRQLATLVESGIPLLSGLESIHHQASSRAFKKILARIIEDLHSGISFSEALTKHPRVFSEIYCKTIASAEQTGRLDTILRQMADFQEKQSAAMKKIKGALTYPAIILSVGVVVVFVLMTTALPALIQMFTQLKVQLPLPTRMLIATTHFLTAYKIQIVAVVVLLGIIFAWVAKQPAGRLRLDRAILKLPLIGPPLHASEIGRFSRTASVLLTAGLSLQEIMELIPSTIGNRAIRHSLERVNEGLIRGEGLYTPMSRDELFLPLLMQMIMVGEESNTLHYTLSVAANFYEQNSEDKINALVRFIQPASTVAISGIVGFIALSVIMPMYSITGAF